MRRLFNRLRTSFSRFSMSPRDRFLSASVDLNDLEHRQKSWDSMILDRDRYYRNGNF